MEESYYKVSGKSPCGISGRYTTIFPAENEEEAILLFVKSLPHVQYITEVKIVSKIEYDAQENGKKLDANRKENEIRWNQILKESRKKL